MRPEFRRRRGMPAPPTMLAFTFAWCLALGLAWGGAGTASAAYAPFTDAECMACHAKPDLVKKAGDKTLSMVVSLDVLKKSAHDRIACVACHRDLQKPDHKGETLALARCDGCHADQTEAYAASVHGKALAQGKGDAARCTDCHGAHEMLPAKNIASPVSKLNLPRTCGRCHSDPILTAKHKIKYPEAVAQFTDSIHGKALLTEGLVVAPSCADCHGVHEIRRDSDTHSTISPAHVGATCGKCHPVSQIACEGDAHGQAVAKGGKSEKTGKEGPTCVGCHSAHQIAEMDDLAARQAADERCGSCHEDSLKTYRETYHGKAMALGHPKVAACYDCHGHHNVLPHTQAASTLSPQNILATCQQCHSMATAKFTQYHAHADHSDRANYPILYWTFLFMTALLVGTFGFFGLHTALWLTRSLCHYLRNPKALRQDRADVRTDSEWFARFTPFQRFLHYLIITSFLLLVLTGMPLKFYYAGWAKVLMRCLGGVEVARTLHRFGAIVTFGYFGMHLVAMAVALWRRRAEFRDAASGRFRLRRLLAFAFGPDSPLPNLQDVRDFGAHVKWFLGLGPRPQFDRWTYWEKFDYFAVFWGVAIIGASGLILWASQAATRLLPGWMINVALIIHSDEALLAAGFIFTIHFFNNHLRPEKFPMDPLMFSGRISKAELVHTRKRWHDRMVASGQLEACRVKDEWDNWKPMAKPFGWAAVAVGVALLVLILYALVPHLLH